MPDPIQPSSPPDPATPQGPAIPGSEPAPAPSGPSRPVQVMSADELEAASRELLSREAPDGYIQEWTKRLAMEADGAVVDEESLVVFRVEDQWYGIPTRLLMEITEDRKPHKVPHRSNDVFLGLVNIRGQLRMCASLRGLLKIERTETVRAKDTETDTRKDLVYRRMLMVSDQGLPWVFPVDQVQGVIRFPRESLLAPPVTVARSTVRFTTAVVNWGQRLVRVIDGQRMFLSLRRSIE